MDDPAINQKLLETYHRLFARYGPQHWWPAETPFEVIVGAILTQSTSWINVEKAIANLRMAKALSPPALDSLPIDKLSTLVHPAGYYNVKAMRLKSFVRWLGQRYNHSLDRLLHEDVERLRQELLSVHGIGEETADSIILYAAGKPVFVIDAYTRRILKRIGLAPNADSYHAFQALFMGNLTHDAQLFNEYHALMVRLGKDVCRRRPLCQQCCLNDLCPYHS
ncbi:MAG TPA: endonuclease III domain-containing protein [Dehalococcoidia bacterium]|nr:endonuclease III domain-containing protein [Dehalococcoidia bacterium]